MRPGWWGFERDQMLLPTACGWDLTDLGEHKLTDLAAPSCPRAVPGPTPHLAGMLGQALAGHLLGLDFWVASRPVRALVITPSGERQLLARFAPSSSDA